MLDNDVIRLEKELADLRERVAELERHLRTVAHLASNVSFGLIRQAPPGGGGVIETAE